MSGSAAVKLRDRDRLSIREFLQTHADKLTGTVMDYGCGLQPYRDIVIKAGGTYFAWDHPTHGGSVVDQIVGQPVGMHDAIICTQVIQYVRDIDEFLEDIWYLMRSGGWLLMTGPTNWPVIENDDLWRFTPNGIAHLLTSWQAGQRFPVVELHERHSIDCGGERWACGWAVAARAAE